jgi:CRP/FNR family transcriptional regulator
MVAGHTRHIILAQENDKTKVFELFRHIKLFQPLTNADIESMAERFYISHYDKETAIFHESDDPHDLGNRLYFVSEGCVKLVKYSSDGESTIVRLVAPGEFFGVTSAITNQPFPFSAIAFTDTNLLTITKDLFMESVREHPQLAVDMIVALGEMLWFNYETHNQVVKKTDARVAKIILYHFRRDGYQKTADGYVLNIALPHHYLASMTGIAYEESVRIVSRLKKHFHCLTYLRGGKLIITDLNRLQHLASEDEVWAM